MNHTRQFERRTINVENYNHGVNLVNYLTRKGYRMPRYNRAQGTVTFSPHDRRGVYKA